MSPLSSEEFDESSVFVSNPIVNKIIIKGLGNKVNKIEVFNIMGKSVIVKDARGTSSMRIETSGLSSGLYFIKFHMETSIFTKKIIKI